MNSKGYAPITARSGTESPINVHFAKIDGHHHPTLTLSRPRPPVPPRYSSKSLTSEALTSLTSFSIHRYTSPPGAESTSSSTQRTEALLTSAEAPREARPQRFPGGQIEEAAVPGLETPLVSASHFCSLGNLTSDNKKSLPPRYSRN